VTLATIAIAVLAGLLILASLAWLQQGERAAYWRSKYAWAVEYIEWLEHDKPPISGLPMPDPRFTVWDLEREP
jgi:hypothetical protein